MDAHFKASITGAAAWTVIIISPGQVMISDLVEIAVLPSLFFIIILRLHLVKKHPSARISGSKQCVFVVICKRTYVHSASNCKFQPHCYASAKKTNTSSCRGVLGCDFSDCRQHWEKTTSPREQELLNWNVHYRCIDTPIYRVTASPGAILGCDETMTQEQPNLETSWVS